MCHALNPMPVKCDFFGVEDQESLFQLDYRGQTPGTSELFHGWNAGGVMNPGRCIVLPPQAVVRRYQFGGAIFDHRESKGVSPRRKVTTLVTQITWERKTSAGYGWIKRMLVQHSSTQP